MSQWGAYGYAQHGWTYDRILAHYYSGTTLGPAPVSIVRVLLAQAKKMTIGSTAPWSVTDSAGTKASLDPGTLTMKDSARDAEPEAGAAVDLRRAPSRSLSTARSTGARSRSRRTASDSRSIDSVGLESYLKGVVPAEMPSEVACGGAEGAGGRGPLVRARQPGRRSATSTSTPTRATRFTAASPPSRRLRARRSWRPRGRSCCWRRQGRRHALLLDVRRSHRLGRGGHRHRGALSRLGRRPVRHDLARARLGPGALRRRPRSRSS